MERETHLNVITINSLDDFRLISAMQLDVPDAKIEVGSPCQKWCNFYVQAREHLYIDEFENTFVSQRLINDTTPCALCFRANVSISLSFLKPECKSSIMLFGDKPP
jgi:hypothetical protein